MRRSIQATSRLPSGVVSIIGNRAASLTSFNVRAVVKRPFPSSIANRLLALVLSPFSPGIDQTTYVRLSALNATLGPFSSPWTASVLLFTRTGGDQVLPPSADQASIALRMGAAVISPDRC